MRADYRVLFDACVLIPMPLADTLLRLTEAPRSLGSLPLVQVHSWYDSPPEET